MPTTLHLRVMRSIAFTLAGLLASASAGANNPGPMLEVQCESVTVDAARQAGSWRPLTHEGALLRQGGAPCWVRFSGAARKGQALAFASTRAAVALYNERGVLLGSADRYGDNQHAFQTINYLLFSLPTTPTVKYARVALDPYYGYDKQFHVELVDLSSTLAEQEHHLAFEVATLACLLVIAFVATLFAGALRSANYALFAGYAGAIAAIVAFRLYLPQQWSGSAQFSWIWFCAMYPLANAMGLLVMVRLGRFHLHSPLANRMLLGIAASFGLLAPFWYVAAPTADLVNSALHVFFLPVLYLACWRGWRRGDLVCLLMMAASVPIALLWVPGFIADLAGLSTVTKQTGAARWLSMASDLLLPLLFLGLLARRTVSMRERATFFELNDPITGLPNRADLQRLSAAPALAAEELVVLVPNVKRFRLINEALGTHSGDLLLAEVGKRLQAAGALHVARLHADQFCLVTTNAQWERVRAELDNQFSAPALMQGKLVDLKLAIGVARGADIGAANQGASPFPLLRLVRNAEIALDVARAHYLDWVEYDKELEAGRQSNLGLMSDLSRALAQGEFRLHLQPKIRMHDGAIISAEALIRWQHPSQGLITPEHFVPFAEKTGCIRMITNWVVEEAIKLAARLREGGTALQIAVNLSAYDLGDPALLPLLLELLERHGAQAGDIRLEMTEHSAMSDPAATLDVMNKLRGAGFSLSIDDFGTGYSSLSYLQRMPVAELKIDRAFVSKVRPGLGGYILLQSIVELGHRLGLSVVAEGVETQEEWEMLRGLQCDFAQGYFAAAPMGIKQFTHWLADTPRFDAQASNVNALAAHG